MLLALDTTAAIATAAIFRDGVLLDEREADPKKKHAETALPLIDDLLEGNGVSIADVDLFAVDIGPGSFTGVRIGVSLVNALAFATGRKVVPVDALAVLAQAANEREKPICALIDARNGNAYAALYRAKKTLIEPCAVETAAFLERIPPDTVFVGDLIAGEKNYPRARSVGALAFTHTNTAKDEAEPMYLRPSQAERVKQKSGGEAKK